MSDFEQPERDESDDPSLYPLERGVLARERYLQHWAEAKRLLAVGGPLEQRAAARARYDAAQYSKLIGDYIRQIEKSNRRPDGKRNDARALSKEII